MRRNLAEAEGALAIIESARTPFLSGSSAVVPR
jgi:hypothetical protein